MKIINLIDPKGRKSFMYTIEDKSDSLKSELQRLMVKSQDLGDKTRRSFTIDTSKDKEILVLSLMEEQVFVNMATVVKGVLKLASVSTKIDFIKTESVGTVELYYTPTSKRKIFVIDIETGDEIEPEFNITETGETKGIINLELGKKYITLELRDDAYKSILIGACQLLLEEDMLKLNISKEEAKRIRVDKYLELINSGKSIEQKLSDASIEKER